MAEDDDFGLADLFGFTRQQTLTGNELEKVVEKFAICLFGSSTNIANEGSRVNFSDCPKPPFPRK